MGRVQRGLLAVVTLAWTSGALAADKDFAAPASRKARMDARNARLGAAAEDKDKGEAKLMLGLARDAEPGGIRTWSTPFSASYQTPGDTGWTKLELTGDGYSRRTEPGAPTASGLADLVFNLHQALSPRWTAVVGAAVPTGGEAGGPGATQHLRLWYQSDAKQRWSYALWADLKHHNHKDPGESRLTRTAYAELDYNIDADRVLLANLTWIRRPGAATPTATDLGVEYDFPFSSRLGGAVLLTTGLTRAARHTSLEFDLNYRF